MYYGSTAASPDDTSAVWNVYDSQFSAGAWTVGKVSNTSNRVGAVCLSGSASTTPTGNWTANGVTKELPEIVLAFEQ